MKNIDNEKKIAVLIDADNAQYSKIKQILAEISSHGHIITKRAYGDWSTENLKNWKNPLNEYSIQPIQQFAYTTGKNSTDASMIIDAMDLLYTEKYDAFAIISSDSDFTRLAARLRESEIFVFGVGENKTPTAFRNACDDFILVENIEKEVITIDKPEPLADQRSEVVAPTSKSLRSKETEEELDIELLKKLLGIASEKYSDENGWTNVVSAIQYIKRSRPDFDPRSFGHPNMPSLLKSLDSFYETSKFPGKGTVMIVGYRPRN